MSTTEPRLAQSIRTTAETLVICTDGQEFCIPWERCSPRLERASDIERQQAELSPGGYGIHWPIIDEDLTTDGLLRKLDS